MPSEIQTVEVEETLNGGYTQTMRVGKHELIADEPENLGGNDNVDC